MRGDSAENTESRLLLMQGLSLFLLIALPLLMGGTGPMARVLLIAGGSLLPLLWLTRTRRCLIPPGFFPLLLLCAWFFLQLIPLPPQVIRFLTPGYAALYDQGLWLFAPLTWRPLSLVPAATLNEALRLSAYAGFYLVMVNLLSSATFLRQLLRILAIFFGVYAFVGLVQFFMPGSKVLWFFASWPVTGGNHFATYVNRNHYAGLLGMIIPLLIVVALRSFPPTGYGSWRERLIDLFTDRQLSSSLLFCLISILAMVSVFFSLSRGGTLSMAGSSLVMLGLLLANRSLHGRRRVFVVVLVCAATLGAFFGLDPLIQRFATTFTASGELNAQRPEYWRDSLDLFQAAPLTGSGAGTFIDAYPPWQTAQTGISVVDHAHNDYVEALTDLGLVGITLLAWFWISFLRSVLPAWKKRRSGQARLVCCGAFSGLVAISLHSFTDFNLAIPANGLYFMLLLAILASTSHYSENSAQSSLAPARPKSIVQLAVLFTVVIFVVVGTSCLHFWSRYQFAPFEKVSLATARPAELDEIHLTAERLAVLAPWEESYPFTVATVAGLKGQLDSAAEALASALQLRPLSSEMLLQAARIAYAAGEGQKAEKLLHGAMRTAPQKWRVRRELADFLFADGRMEEGMLVLRDGLSSSPAQIRAVLQQLILHKIDREQMKLALPDLSEPWRVYGDFRQQLGELSPAEQAYQQGVKYLVNDSVPSIHIFWRYLDLLGKQKRYAEALLLIQQALNFFPGNASLLARQAVLYDRENLRDRAMESYRASLLMNPDQEWIRQRLKMLQQ